MTFAELWTMVHARRRQQRALVVAQAIMVWDDGKIDREAYINRGEHKAPRKVRKYNPQRLAALASGKAYNGG